MDRGIKGFGGFDGRISMAAGEDEHRPGAGAMAGMDVRAAVADGETACGIDSEFQGCLEDHSGCGFAAGALEAVSWEIGLGVVRADVETFDRRPSRDGELAIQFEVDGLDLGFRGETAGDDGLVRDHHETEAGLCESSEGFRDTG